MKEWLSLYAFSAHCIVDGVQIGVSGRPVMSRGILMAPLTFFRSALGADICEDPLTIRLNGHRFQGGEGKYEAFADEQTVTLPAAPRREGGCLVVPVTPALNALGIFTLSFDEGRFVVAGREDGIRSLTDDEEKRAKLAERTCGVYNAAYFTKEDFALARQAWRRDLCGDEAHNDPAVPGMKRLLAARDAECERLQREMRREKDAPILFGDRPPQASADLKAQYDRILAMALAYGTGGCRLYRSKTLLADIVLALDWMHDHMYGADVLSDSSFRSYRAFNWWEWYVGGACPMMDTVMILDEDLTREQKDRYLLPVDFLRTQMRVSLGPTEGMSRIVTLTPLALLHEDRALLQACYVDECALLEEHDEGNAMRRDGCCMTHGMPYNIGYGACNLSRTAKILHILEGSPLAFPCRKRYNLMTMARYTFAPVLYRGQGFGMMNGRIMQRDGSSAALDVLGDLHYLFGLFGEEEDAELVKIYRRNATKEIKAALLGGDGAPEDPPVRPHIGSLAQTAAALAGAEADEYVFAHMWYSGDCAVQFRNGCALAVRMNSGRSYGYECMNGVNGDAWYTGDGMVYLYTPADGEQYGRAWWDHVDKLLMPGTTAEDRPRECMFFDRPYRSSRDFVGGVELEGQFVCASMDLESFHNEVDEHRPDRGYGRSLPLFDCSLTAEKSYFLFDRAMLAMGSAVCAHDGYDVRTVIDNRRISDTMRDVRLNGEILSLEPARFTRSDLKILTIPGVGGYIFPLGGTITVRVSRDGGGTFLAFWFEHGTDPENGDYAYIAVPDASYEETAALAESGDIEILSRGGGIHAAREKHSGLTGMIFRKAASFGGVTACRPMILMTRETRGRMSLCAADPTQRLREFSFSLHSAAGKIEAEERMEAARDGEKVTFRVTCDSSPGRGYAAAWDTQNDTMNKTI